MPTIVSQLNCHICLFLFFVVGAVLLRICIQYRLQFQYFICFLRISFAGIIGRIHRAYRMQQIQSTTTKIVPKGFSLSNAFRLKVYERARVYIKSASASNELQFQCLANQSTCTFERCVHRCTRCTQPEIYSSSFKFRIPFI